MLSSKKVLITTSGVGSRLGKLTQYTNKALVRVGAKAAISNIISAYPENTRFVVTLGYFGDLVKQYLSLAHPNSDITYVQVQPYKGEGSSLVYSMSCAKQFLQEPFVYHCCDTLIPELSDPKGNWVGLNNTNPDYNNGSYRTVTIVDNKITSINEKGISGNGAYIGVVGIQDYKEFWKVAEDLLSSENQELSDANVVATMIHAGCLFTPVTFPVWLDTGNIGSLTRARNSIWGEQITVLEKPDQAVYLLEDKVIKFFSTPSMVTSRVLRAKNLEGAVPEILGSTQNFFAYKRLYGRTFTEEVTPATFEKFLAWCSSNLWKDPILPDSLQRVCGSFYITKTKHRLTALYSKLGIKDSELVINNRVCPKDSVMLKKVEQLKELYEGPFYKRFHGDLHNGNIFWDGKTFGLIDWREDFGGQLEYGDIYYDLAKLNHGLIVSHDLVEANQFITTHKDNGILIDIHQKLTLSMCQDTLRRWCADSGFSMKHVDLITALIFLNISPLHHSSYDEFLYYLGKYLLTIALEVIDYGS